MRMLVTVLCAIVLTSWNGCSRTAENNQSQKPVAKPVEDHDHDHMHGPQGSIAFSLTGAEFKVEVITNKTNDLVRVFVLDHDAKKNLPIKAEKVTVRTDKLGGKAFDLKPVNPDANGLTAEYSLDDKELKSITGLKPTLEITADGKTYSGTMELH